MTFNYPTQFHHQFKKPVESLPAPETNYDFVRVRPGQKHDAVNFSMGIAPDLAKYLAQYALNEFVYTAVNLISQYARSVDIKVVRQDDATKDNPNHPIMAILGKYGQPNDHQSTREFWALHHTYYHLAGNVYWYWDSNQVYLLHPSMVRIIPGVGRTVQRYEYWVSGHRYSIPTAQITHHKKANPFNLYYGLPALEALYLTMLGDYKAKSWNAEFFGSGVSIPAGILVIPPEVGERERDRLQEEFNQGYGQQRKTMVARVPAGGTAWFDASLNRRDMDFRDARELARKATYEAFHIPLALQSETSTEALARVAERQMLTMVHNYLGDIADKLNPEVMGFWRGSNVWAVEFEDIRREALDWDQQERKYKSWEKFATINEMRVSQGLPPMEGGDELPTNNQQNRELDRRDPRAVQSQRQVRDVVESPE